jgi:hypothetical protein
MPLASVWLPVCHVGATGEKDPLFLHAPARKSEVLLGAGNHATVTAGVAMWSSWTTPATTPGSIVQGHSRRISCRHTPPELNLIERAWKFPRKLRIHNLYFETLNRLLEEVTERLPAWARPNDVLRRLCCIT